jgi:hypothetical protein
MGGEYDGERPECNKLYKKNNLYYCILLYSNYRRKRDLFDN